MKKPSRILVQTTIASFDDDWNVGRFSLLCAHLASLRGRDGMPLFEVTARDREPPDAPDSVLSRLDTSSFDQLWLFAVDTGDGLTTADCEAITRFRHRGGGMLVARDHMNLGSSVCKLGGVGAAHFFHSRNPDPDPSRRRIDDAFTHDILWPNYHSGANGDYQRVDIVAPLHPVLIDPEASDGAIRYLPSHPHEGAVGQPPDDPSARVIATGRSKSTERSFNLMVAFEPTAANGPAMAESTFHHFADYNWNPSLGSPSFVSEAPGDALAHSAEAQQSIRRYVRNLALWLGGLPIDTPVA